MHSYNTLPRSGRPRLGSRSTGWSSCMVYSGVSFVRSIGRAQALGRTRLERIGIRGQSQEVRLQKLQVGDGRVGWVTSWASWPLVMPRYGTVRADDKRRTGRGAARRGAARLGGTARHCPVATDGLAGLTLASMHERGATGCRGLGFWCVSVCERVSVCGMSQTRRNRDRTQ